MLRAGRWLRTWWLPNGVDLDLLCRTLDQQWAVLLLQPPWHPPWHPLWHLLDWSIHSLLVSFLLLNLPLRQLALAFVPSLPTRETWSKAVPTTGRRGRYCNLQSSHYRSWWHPHNYKKQRSSFPYSLWHLEDAMRVFWLYQVARQLQLLPGRLTF